MPELKFRSCPANKLKRNNVIRLLWRILGFLFASSAHNTDAFRMREHSQRGREGDELFVQHSFSCFRERFTDQKSFLFLFLSRALMYSVTSNYYHYRCFSLTLHLQLRKGFKIYDPFSRTSCYSGHAGIMHEEFFSPVRAKWLVKVDFPFLFRRVGAVMVKL
jgi:hypothetical protein